MIKEKLGYYWVGEDNFDSPDRVLHNIRNINNTVIKEFIYQSNPAPWWPNYTSAIAKYHKNDLIDAKNDFYKVIMTHSPLISKFKSLYYLIKIYLNIKTK